MQNVLDNFLKNLKASKRRHLRVISILLVLSLLVSTEVFWMLRQTGIAMAGDAACGIEEHTHTGECPENCDKIEHVHSIGCYSDETADVETAADWQAMFADVALTGELGKDLAAIAKTQIGYSESERNYQVDSSGNKHGYTRYGAWYGFPYNDWSAMFVSYCLHYAGSPSEQTPYNIGAGAMAAMWEKLGKYTDDDSYVPVVGDLMFTYDNTVGIVYDTYDNGITVIKGDVNGKVVSQTIQPTDSSIKGWGLITTDADTTIDPGLDLSAQYKAWAVVSEPVTVSGLNSVATSATSLMAAETNATVSDGSTMIDMSDMITAVKTEEMINGIWTEISSGTTVTHGDKLRFTISYTVPGQTLSPTNNVIYYNLPTAITSVQHAEGNVYNETGSVVGTFIVDEESKQIRIIFNSEYAEKNQNGAEIVGGLHFITTVDSIFQGGDDTEGLIFNDKITVDLKVQDAVAVTGDVHVEKTIAEVTGNVIKYTVTITSNEGTHTQVVLTDTMSGGLVFKELISGDGSLSVAEDKTSFTVTLPKMSAGGQYVITYTAQLPEGSIANTNLVNNKADVESTDDQNNPIKDSSEVDHTFNMLNKYSHNNGDGSYTWIIEINQAKYDISGWILSDTMSINGVEKEFTGTVTLTDSAGNTKQVDLPYTFPNGSDDSYTVTYTTTHSPGPSGTNSVVNKAKLVRGPDDNETPIEDDEGIDIGVGDPLQKTGEIIGKDDDGNLLIKWTVTIDTSDYAIGDGVADNWDWYFYDKLDDDQYMTYDQMMAAIASIKEAWESAGIGIEDYRAAVYVPSNDPSGATYGEWHYSQKETYFPSSDDGTLYERFRVYMDGQIPKGKTVTFSYVATAPIVPGVFNYGNRVTFNGDDNYEVTGEVQYNVTEPTIFKYAKFRYNENEDVTYFDEDWFEYWGESADSEIQLDYDQNVYRDLLCWMLQIHIPTTYKGNGDLVITETLPEGLSLEFMQARTRHASPLYAVKWVNDNSGSGSFEWWYKDVPYTAPFTVEGQVITITVPEKTIDLILDNIPSNIQDEEGHRLYIYIWASLDEDLQWQNVDDVLTKQVSFTNKVTMTDGKNTTFGTASQTQVITKDLTKTAVDKFHANSTADNFVEYEVILNKDGYDLDPTKDYLDIEDILSYSSPNASPIRVRLVPGSVKLYTYSDAADFVPTELDFSYTYDETSVNDTANAAVIWTNTLALTIPDETPVKLVYRYAVTGKEGDVARLDNVCSIVGKYSGSIDDSDHMEFALEQPSATANITSVYIYKVDKNNNGLYLPGAQFNLYMYDKASGEYLPVIDTATGENRVFTTGEDGTFRFHFHHDQEEDATAYHLSYDTAYKLVEIKAPDGYFLNPTPYEFYIKGSSTDPLIPDGYTGHVHETGDLIYYEDQKDITEITLEKIWQDEDRNVLDEVDVESITVTLWQKTASTSGVAYKTVTLTKENGWKTTVTDLPSYVRNDDGTPGEKYLYYVEELIVKYYTPYYTNNGGINDGKITITNRKDVTYALPATGGGGILPFVLLGAVLITIPIVYEFTSRRNRERRSKT